MPLFQLAASSWAIRMAPFTAAVCCAGHRRAGTRVPLCLAEGQRMGRATLLLLLAEGPGRGGAPRWASK